MAVRQRRNDYCRNPDKFRTMKTKDGSWWADWVAWPKAHSGSPTAPPAMGAPQAGYPALGDAPGSYVLED
jgi:polyhydroxyalkanoate synthase subunit PhaC